MRVITDKCRQFLSFMAIWIKFNDFHPWRFINGIQTRPKSSIKQAGADDSSTDPYRVVSLITLGRTNNRINTRLSRK